MLSLLARNWHLKLLSVVLAYALWVAVAGEDVLLRDLAVPLEIDLAEGYILAAAAPTQVNVRLRGPESILGRIDPFRMKLLVDLGGVTPGERTVQLSDSDLVGVPRGTEVVIVEPQQIGLRVDEKVRRRLPVVPTLVGQPPSGHELYDLGTVPATLVVEGPKSVMDVLENLGTDPIHLEGRTEPFEVRVGAVPAKNGVRVLDAQPVQVRVDVDAAPVDFAIGSVKVEVAGEVFETQVTPKQVRVTVSGPPALVEQVSRDGTHAVVDVEGLSPRAEPYRVSPRIVLEGLPPRQMGRVTLKTVDPKSVSVRVSDRRI